MLHAALPLEGTENDADRIAEGDLIVVYERFDSMKAAYVKSGGAYGSRFGTFRMKEWIGKPYGSRAFACSGQGWVYLLKPNPELWTQVLRHRTQILYAADIALITAFLELRPGCTVLESGTGSGSLTHALARAVAPSGRVHTFEFHAHRAQEASDEFARNGLGGVVTLEVRDIEAAGFPSELASAADAVFLDLPRPWQVVPSAAACLRPDGAFCAFSPCIEQVQRTCGALARHGFAPPRTMECLLRQYEVRTEPLATDPEAAAAAQGAGRKRKHGAAGGPAVAAPSSDGAAEITRVVVARPRLETRGHTGYLTFSRRRVDCSVAEDEEAVAGGHDGATISAAADAGGTIEAEPLMAPAEQGGASLPNEEVCKVPRTDGSKVAATGPAAADAAQSTSASAAPRTAGGGTVSGSEGMGGPLFDGLLADVRTPSSEK